MTNDEGSPNALAFAKPSARQANDEKACKSFLFVIWNFVIPSSFDIRASSFPYTLDLAR